MLRVKIQPLDTGIILSASLFVFVLGVAAYLDQSIITLHMVEALPFIAGPWLCLRRYKFGYALTFASGAFWLWTGGFLTTFVRNGFEQLLNLVQTGTLERFDILIAVPAAMGTAGMVLFSFVSYLKCTDKKLKDILLYLLAMVIVALFFLGIFKLFAPGYLEMFNGIFD